METHTQLWIIYDVWHHKEFSEWEYAIDEDNYESYIIVIN